jgi:hypothetical protein
MQSEQRVFPMVSQQKIGKSMDESKKPAFQVDFNSRLKLEFRSSM